MKAWSSFVDLFSYSMFMSESNWECHKHSFKRGRVELGATALVQTSKGNHVCHKDVIAPVMSIICERAVHCQDEIWTIGLSNGLLGWCTTWCYASLHSLHKKFVVRTSKI